MARPQDPLPYTALRRDAGAPIGGGGCFELKCRGIERLCLCCAPFSASQGLKQFGGYVNRFGPGLVIYWMGFMQGLRCPPEVLIMDDFPEESEIQRLSGWAEAPPPPLPLPPPPQPQQAQQELPTPALLQQQPQQRLQLLAPPREPVQPHPDLARAPQPHQQQQLPPLQQQQLPPQQQEQQPPQQQQQLPPLQQLPQAGLQPQQPPPPP